MKRRCLLLVTVVLSISASAQWNYRDQPFLANASPQTTVAAASTREFQSLSGVLNTTRGARQYQTVDGVIIE